MGLGLGLAMTKSDGEVGDGEDEDGLVVVTEVEDVEFVFDSVIGTTMALTMPPSNRMPSVSRRQSNHPALSPQPAPAIAKHAQQPRSSSSSMPWISKTGTKAKGSAGTHTPSM